MRAFILTAPAVAIVVTAIAVPARPASAPVRDTPERIWRATCSYCHGGPMNAPELRGRKLPEQVVVHVVRNGAAGMPPFHPSAISDADLRALARWISEQPAPQAPPQPNQPPKP